MWEWLVSHRATAPDEATKLRKRLEALEEQVNRLERTLNTRDVEWTEMSRRMATAAKRASGALGGRPRKDDDNEELELEAANPELERIKRRQRILAMNRRP